MDPSVLQAVCYAGAGIAAACGGFSSSRLVRSRVRRRLLRKAVLEGSGVSQVNRAFAAEGLSGRVLEYMDLLSRRLNLGITKPFSKSLHSLSCKWFLLSQRKAGLEGTISAEAYAEARVRLAGVCLAAGLILGSVFSWELMVGLGLGGLAFGACLPRMAVVQQSRRRAAQLERELPELLEVVALGLRSGLSFDRSFALYPQHFNTSFSAACANAQNSWGLGLCTRESALKDLSATYDSRQFSHVVETMVRALRFGSSLEGELEQAAAEARAVRKAHREELAAKAPVKMMVPTGTLILPAMLLMVLGPVLLEMMNGF